MVSKKKKDNFVEGSNARVMEALSEIHEMESVLVTNKISLTEFLKLVAELFDKANIGFAVAGGLARSIHATPRMTVDLDVVVATSDQDKAIDLLRSAGFAEKDCLEYQKPTRAIRKFEYRGRELDILDFPKNPDLLDFLVATAVKQQLAAVSYSFVGLEGLAVTKLCSFRHKDKGDLDDLKKLTPIDLNIVKPWCSKLGIIDRFAFMLEPPED